jgi:hypothetical protein
MKNGVGSCLKARYNSTLVWVMPGGRLSLG